MKSIVLFVDDEPNVRKGLERMLEDYEEFECEFADAVRTAVDRLEHGSVDAVFTDFNMPGQDGLELIRQMKSREEWHDIPIVMLTGNGESTLKRQALDAGATDLLQKPVDEHDLVARMRSVLQLKQSRDALKKHNALLESKVLERTLELQFSRLEVVLRLSKAAELHDEETSNHTLRVGLVSVAIAETMGSDSKFVETLLLAAPLHDIGKIGIPDHILKKPGTLTEDEFEIMKKHCELGYGILTTTLEIPSALRRFFPIASVGEDHFISAASVIARDHHERWDGSGYPNGKRGDQIDLMARIVAVADAFDAIRSRRRYKEAKGHEETLEIILSESGRQFDPAVVAAFEIALPRVVHIYEELSDESLQMAA